MKFQFEERIQAVIKQYYEVEAESEQEALEMVKQGHGFVTSFTETDDSGEGEYKSLNND
jgi:hypothetical protein